MIVEEIIPSDNIHDYIAEVASVVRDKDPKSAEKLFNRLLTESVGDKASSVLSYIPCKIELSYVPVVSQHFGFVDSNLGFYYTNSRELLNCGWDIKDVLKVVDFTNYKVYKCEAPYFIYQQIRTHTQLNFLSHSQRFADCDRGYWMPPEFSMYYREHCSNELSKQDTWNDIVDNSTPLALKQIMKSMGINRKEVFDRGADMLQNRVFTIGGYTNNPNAFPHFFAQRTDKHTQKETREFVEQLLTKY